MQGVDTPLAHFLNTLSSNPLGRHHLNIQHVGSNGKTERTNFKNWTRRPNPDMLVQFKVMCAETAGNSLAVILLVWADGAGIQ